MNNKLLITAFISIFVLAGCTTDIQNPVSTDDDFGSSEKTVQEDTTSNEGEARPADAPADFPNLENAFDYNFYDGGTLVTFGYKVNGSDLIKLCDDLEGKLKEAGWARSTAGMNSESDDNIYRSFEKGSYKLTEGCSLTDGVPTFALMRNTKK